MLHHSVMCSVPTRGNKNDATSVYTRNILNFYVYMLIAGMLIDMKIKMSMFTRLQISGSFLALLIGTYFFEEQGV